MPADIYRHCNTYKSTTHIKRHSSTPSTPIQLHQNSVSRPFMMPAAGPAPAPAYRGWDRKAMVSSGLRWLKEWWAGSSPTPCTDEQEPPWILGRRANHANCPFYMIPEEIVLRIVSNLDHFSKAMAMRTCGRFLRISFDPSLCPPKTKGQSVLGNWCVSEISVWPPFEQDEWSVTYQERLALRARWEQMDRLLDRDRFCAPCRRFRDDGRYKNALQALQEPLWCSYCEKTHKRAFFSAHERTKATTQDDPRICILGEGKSQVCAHLSIKLDTTGTTLYPEIEESNRPWIESESWLLRGGIHTCRHPDHDQDHRVPWHQRWMGSFSDQSERPCVNNLERGSRLSLKFGTTIFIANVNGEPHETRAWLQERLADKADALDKMTCPHVTARDGQLMLPFAPGHCACFDSHGWPAHTSTLYDSNSCHPILWGGVTRKSGLCCRCQTAQSASGSREGHKLMASEDGPGSPNIHQYECQTCSCTYTWRRLDLRLYLQIEGHAQRFGPSSLLDWKDQTRYHWLSNIHPDSFGIQQDVELRHVAWCDDINCMTRWRWDSLLRLLWDAWHVGSRAYEGLLCYALTRRDLVLAYYRTRFGRRNAFSM
ncbi:hypothetical protein V8F33_005184 [Rhypophila sp. PSN 637]